MAVGLGCLYLAAGGCGRSDYSEIELKGDRFDGVRRLIGQHLRRNDLASVAIAVAKDGEVVWEDAYGWADRETRTPAMADSIYALASISKTFTATGVMALAERGQIDLDRPINDYLGDTPVVSLVGDADLATVRDVLRHTAGLPTQMNVFVGDRIAIRPSQAESIRRYGIIVDDPGKDFHYSNFGYGLLDRVVAEVSGQTYSEFMQQQIFDPLGLTRTGMLGDPGIEPYRVKQYDAGGSLVPTLDFDHRGASSVASSVHDLLRFGMFHLGNELPEQERVLSGGSRALMQAPSRFLLPDSAVGEVSIGVGWAVAELLGRRLLVSSGGMPGTVTRLTLLPEADSAVAITINSGATNGYSPWEIEWAAFKAVVPDFPEPPSIGGGGAQTQPIPADVEGEWVGFIDTDQGELPVTLTVQGAGRVVLEVDGARAQPLPARTPLGRVRFSNGVLEAPLLGSLPTSEARRAPHVLMVRLRLRGDRLTGVVSAVARDETFWLPYWTELERKRGG